jgi:hypothetical protein
VSPSFAVAGVAAAAPFYGPFPDGGDLGKAKAAVLAIYGGLDARVGATRPAAQAALRKARLDNHVMVVGGADHAFSPTGRRWSSSTRTTTRSTRPSARRTGLSRAAAGGDVVVYDAEDPNDLPDWAVAAQRSAAYPHHTGRSLRPRWPTPTGRPRRRVGAYGYGGLNGRSAASMAACSRPGSCSARAKNVEAFDAYRRIDGSFLRDPCFADPTRDDAVLWVRDPFSRGVVRLRVSGSLDRSGSAPSSLVWAVPSADGQRCTYFAGGAASAGAAGRRAESGSDAATSVPPPAGLSISRRPPSAATLSLIPTSP